jgi:hypothetical protein
MVRNCTLENLKIPGLALARHPGMTMKIIREGKHHGV